MSQDYKETLYINLFNVLNELTEHESPEVIFDRIVEDFAMNAEYHMGKADTFKSMLDTFRHDNPANTIPGEQNIEQEMFDAPELNWNSILDNTDPRKRHLMSADSDAFNEFLEKIKFPG